MTDPDPMIPMTDAFLDRIVDGELSAAALRQALERLDREPDGWKRCALAFVEAQCWRESFRAQGCPMPAPAEGVARPAPETAPRSGRPSGGWRRVAIAAGLAAVSFTLGWGVRLDRSTPGAPGVSTAPTTENQAPRTEAANPGDLAGRPEGPRITTLDELLPEGPAPPVVTVGRLRVGPSASAVAVPILAGPGIDEDWVRNQPSPITEHQQAILEQQGFQVDRRRHLIRKRLVNGRNVTVPVDQVEVRYTGIESL